MKTSTLKKMFKQITHNEIAMYLLLAVAVLNLLTYLQYNYLGGIIIFFFISLLSTHYTKNMVIILASSILITNLLVSLGFLSSLGLKEGLKNKENEEESESDEESNDNKLKNTEKSKENNKKAIKKEKEKEKENKVDEKKGEDEEEQENEDHETDDNLDIKGKSTKAGFKNLDEEEYDSASISNNNISQEKMMKEVQGQMNKLLGNNNGNQKFDTNTILQQQKELMKAMENMKPLMDGANKMIGGLATSPIGSMLGLNKI